MLFNIIGCIAIDRVEYADAFIPIRHRYILEAHGTISILDGHIGGDWPPA